jgi:hypothetical protein
MHPRFGQELLQTGTQQEHIVTGSKEPMHEDGVRSEGHAFATSSVRSTGL